MKNFFFAAAILCTLGLAGCESMSKPFFEGESGSLPNRWDGSGYKRTERIGTGIDPEARDIEKRLGYSK